MRMPLGYILIKTLHQGAEILEEDVKCQVRAFVESQKMGDESFMNRGGKSDLYYTMFGWMLCYVLNIETDKAKREAYINNVEVRQLDALHKTVFEQCRLVDELLKKGLWRTAIGNWSKRHHIEEFFGQFAKHTVGRSVNGEAARLLVGSDAAKSHQSGADIEEKKAALEYIRGMQDETGGFLANEGAAMPDLLTTAVALFTLKAFGMKARYGAVDFVGVHFREDGGFMPNILDEESDVEYVFYGLLALGSL